MELWLPKWSEMYLHVKWFTKDHTWIPQPMSQVINTSFLFWLGFTVIVLLLLAFFHDTLERIPFIRRIHEWLNLLKKQGQLILRIGLGLGLLLQLSTGTYLSPEFTPEAHWVDIVLIAAIAGLLHRKTLFISSTAILLLYIHATLVYGIFHTLDYLFYPGIVYYLYVCTTRWRATAAPILYISTGLSLAWLAMEKLTIAKLAHSLMHDYGIPTLGFSVEDFVLISAFIEMGLAWSFIVGFMNRFTSILLTGVFLMTTMVFGIKEIIGHTIIHTLLIMFLIEGSGDYKTPFQFHRSSILRGLFVAVNFCIFLFGLMALYIWMGQAAMACH
ncbi:hypothetical protein SAMN05661091_5564 [Paenibacillus uliginis N3/975]|uniref:DoxX protein n=1 Tax=Paenibacillus uliginis N3/975 TaxID=1313296 RepID=A0A1X7HSN4_9BACL|nr:MULTISPECIES: hypothetical protein [Paenibacillus]UNK18899.1 hypothetical protein MNQ98_02285 [Paenibacillus sp. N3/727]SMF91766.1 hypothetical protein SAMN05661091_5564 [Paenibacillus uliginis N3/975]